MTKLVDECDNNLFSYPTIEFIRFEEILNKIKKGIIIT